MSSGGKEEEKQSLRMSDVEPLRPVKSMDDFVRLGWYCTFVLIAAEAMVMTSLSSMVYMVYAGLSPNIVSCGNVNFNSTREACELLPILQAETNCKPVLDYPFLSVNVEFSMLCEEGKLVKNAISIQMLGVLFGAVLFGQLSDTYGRKKTLLLSMTGIMVTCIASYYVQTFFQFVVLRVLVGFFTGGLNSVQGVYLIENIPRDHRMWINQIITWSPNFIIFPYICYLMHTWRNLALWNAFAAALGVILISCLYESPRWFIQKGRISEARHVITRIRHINRDRCEKEAEEVEAMLAHEQEMVNNSNRHRKKYSYLHIFCTWTMMFWTLTLCFGIGSTSLINYGLLFNMEKLSGNLYWNNAFFGMIRWAINIAVGLTDFFTDLLGRKMINSASVAFNSLTLAAIAATFFSGHMADMSWVTRYGTIGITAVCSQIYLAKNLTASALQISSRIGTVLAPQLFYLSDISPGLPYLVLLVVSTLDFLFFQVFIPETKGRNLENHLPPKEKRIFYKKVPTDEESV